LDLAKNVFQVQGVNSNGKSAIRRQLRQAQMLSLKLSLCVIGIEVWASAHY
jgi:transposase